MATSYDIITDVKRQELQDNYAIFINAHANVYSCFEWTQSNLGFLGYKVTYNDYVGMVSHVGVVTWLVRFGCDNEAVDVPKFCLLVTGIDQGGFVVTPNYRLTQPISEQIANLNERQFGDVLVSEVPTPLVNPWKEAWNNLIVEQNIPKDICQTNYGLLQGYNFHTDDFMGVLEGIDATSALDNEVDFFMANHAELAIPPAAQSDLPGTVGVMMALSEPFLGDPIFSRVIVSAFYDLTAPCPPTCPDFKNK